jgi:hypothetical protein
VEERKKECTKGRKEEGNRGINSASVGSSGVL